MRMSSLDESARLACSDLSIAMTARCLRITFVPAPS